MTREQMAAVVEREALLAPTSASADGLLAAAAELRRPIEPALRDVFTNEVIRAVGALARQQEVCREQDGEVVFVTGMEAAREYITEHVISALHGDQATKGKAEVA